MSDWRTTLSGSAFDEPLEEQAADTQIDERVFESAAYDDGF